MAHDPAKMVRKNFYFPHQIVARMKAYYKATGVRMSELMRRAVDEYLKREGY